MRFVFRLSQHCNIFLKSFAALDVNPIAALLGLRPAGQISKARSTGESATTRCEHKRLIGRDLFIGRAGLLLDHAHTHRK
jgi:hypothetical protein